MISAKKLIDHLSLRARHPGQHGTSLISCASYLSLTSQEWFLDTQVWFQITGRNTYAIVYTRIWPANHFYLCFCGVENTSTGKIGSELSAVCLDKLAPALLNCDFFLGCFKTQGFSCTKM
jgi:hypothetical protein